MMNEINKILSNYKNHATLFQLTFFVVGKEPTIQAKLKRCADELTVRKRSVENAEMEIEEIKDNIATLKLDIEAANDLQKARREIKVRQLKRKIKYNEKQIKDVENTLSCLKEECEFFISAYQELSKIEKPKDWDSDDVQLEYWTAKFSKEIKERSIWGTPVELELVRSILALPDSSQIKQQALQLMKEKEKLLLSQNTN